MQLSVIDQENAIKKIAQWSELSPSSHYFFQPYKEKNSTMECDDSRKSALSTPTAMATVDGEI